jgi:uncharacterized membrane protein YtjA (UPF0391 family)
MRAHFPPKGGKDLLAGRDDPQPVNRWNQLHRQKLHRRIQRGPAAGRLEDQAVTLLKWALVFFLISVVAGILGFTGLSAASADIARFLFYVFVVIFLVLLILGLTIFRV